MEEENRKRILDALDMLAIALTEYNHQWTEEQHRLYEQAVAILESIQPNA